MGEPRRTRRTTYVGIYTFSVRGDERDADARRRTYVGARVEGRTWVCIVQTDRLTIFSLEYSAGIGLGVRPRTTGSTTRIPQPS